jgi:hypothetical protein
MREGGPHPESLASSLSDSPPCAKTGEHPSKETLARVHDLRAPLDTGDE